MLVFSVVGWSGSGKTTLIERLVQHFRSTGRRVVAAKKAHGGVALEPEAKDSARLLAAGSAEVFVLSGRQLMSVREVDPDEQAYDRIRACVGVDDVLILEGFRIDGVAMIEVFNVNRQAELKIDPASLASVISDFDPGCGVPYLHRDDIAGIAGFLEAHHARHDCAQGQR